MIGFPVDELLSEEECYRYLKRSLHPEGLSCPDGHKLPDDQAPHDRRRAPIMDDRCRECGAVFNIFTDTVWSKTHYDPSTIVMLLRGFAKGISTKHLTDEMDLAYPSVLKRRHRLYLWLENEEETRTRNAVDHSEEWAADQDGDGIREVHVNTIEGI